MASTQTQASKEDEQTMTITLDVVLRPLHEDDKDKNLLELLQQLSTIRSIDPQFYTSRLSSLRANPLQVMIVGEVKAMASICGTGTLVIEPKFIRKAGLVGHLEDLVVEQSLRRKGLGAAIVRKLVSYAQNQGCYKVIIDCSEANVAFYEHCGFKRKDVSLVKYIDCSTDARCTSRQSLDAVLAQSTFNDLVVKQLDASAYERYTLRCLATNMKAREKFCVQQLRSRGLHFVSCLASTGVS
jgi:glucosamine-phosphate N-acetyltransferase